MNEWISSQLSPTFERLGVVVKDIVGGRNLLQLYTQFKLLSSVTTGAGIAAKLAGIGFVFTEIFIVLKRFGVLGRVAGGVFAGMTRIGYGSMAAMIRYRKIWLIAGRILSFIARSAIFYGKIWAGLFLVTRIFQKAKALGEEADIRRGLESIDLLSATGVKLFNLIRKLSAPFIYLTNRIAELITPLFSLSSWISGFSKVLESLTSEKFKNTQDLFNYLEDGISKLVNVFWKAAAAILAVNLKIHHSVQNLSGLLGLGMTENIFKGLSNVVGGKGSNELRGKSLTEYMKFFMDRFGEAESTEEGEAVNFVVNNSIAKIELRNIFPENVEPDRIAIALVDQITKAASNPIGTIRNLPSKIPGLQTGG